MAKQSTAVVVETGEEDLTIDESKLDMGGVRGPSLADDVGEMPGEMDELARLRAENAQLKADKAAGAQAAGRSKEANLAHRNQTEVISLRNFRLASTTGHAVVFKAGEPKYIPNVVLAEAMEKGCVPTDQLDSGVVESLHSRRGRARVQFSGKLRSSVLALFIEDFIASNDTKDFDAAGEVKYKVLSDACGFEVTHTEASEAYRAVRAAQQSGEDLELHADAPIVKQIIEATHKSDLLEILPHTKVKADEIKGMPMRDMRKALLASFAGFSNE